MRKIITIVCLFIFPVIHSQVFTGTGGPIQDNGQDTYFPLNVSGLSPSQIDSTFGLEQVCINIAHPSVKELYIFLQSPSGTMVELTLGSSAAGADYVSTCFDNQAGSSITLGAAPYTGSFKPVGFLGRFNTGQSGNGSWNLVVHDGFPMSNAGTVISWDLKFGTTAAHPVVFNSSNLPLVFINTTAPITELNSMVSMGIVDNGTSRNYTVDPWNGYNGKAEIHIRGSSSKNFEKKSYRFELKDAMGNNLPSSLVGLPSESDWVLTASYTDKTLQRIPLAHDLWGAMGHYTARHKFVELIINNEYQGVYSLVEKPKRSNNRINIEKLEPSENTMPYVSGGYIVKIDRPDEPGWYSQFAGNNTAATKFYFQYDYPDDLVITAAQKGYIQSYFNSFESVMNSSNYADPSTGYPSLIEINSFVDYFLINELSKNIDAFRLSTYLYKESVISGGKLYIGPVWDYDLAWHNCNYGNAFDPNGWAYQLQDNEYPVPTWWVKFMQDPNFVAKVFCRWQELRQTIFDINFLNNYVDGNANLLNESQQRNFKQWPVMGAYIFPNPQNQSGANFWSEVADIKSWLASRIGWLDANIPGPCVIGISEEQLVSGFGVYPNPMSSSTVFDLELNRPADVSLCITDLSGKEIRRYLNANAQTGGLKIKFDRNAIAGGLYLYQLQVNNTIRSGKLVIE